MATRGAVRHGPAWLGTSRQGAGKKKRDCILTCTQKNGPPDIWYGGRLYEEKQGRDRLSDDQRAWHRHYYVAHGEWPRIAFFPESGCAKGCVFQSYMDFEQALANPQGIRCYVTPELLAIYKAAYPNSTVQEEEQNENFEIYDSRVVPPFAESVYRGGQTGQDGDPAGAGGAMHVPFAER